MQNMSKSLISFPFIMHKLFTILESHYIIISCLKKLERPASQCLVHLKSQAIVLQFETFTQIFLRVIGDYTSYTGNRSSIETRQIGHLLHFSQQVLRRKLEEKEHD